MKHIKDFKQLYESDASYTDNNKPPENIIKIQDGDTGYDMIKNSYHRWIWTWNKYANKSK